MNICIGIYLYFFNNKSIFFLRKFRVIELIFLRILIKKNFLRLVEEIVDFYG